LIYSLTIKIEKNATAAIATTIPTIIFPMFI